MVCIGSNNHLGVHRDQPPWCAYIGGNHHPGVRREQSPPWQKPSITAAAHLQPTGRDPGSANAKCEKSVRLQATWECLSNAMQLPRRTAAAQTRDWNVSPLHQQLTSNSIKHQSDVQLPPCLILVAAATAVFQQRICIQLCNQAVAKGFFSRSRAWSINCACTTAVHRYVAEIMSDENKRGCSWQ